MSKKQWIVTAAIILAIVAALSVYYVPRSVDRALGLPEDKTIHIGGHVSKSADSIMSYKTEDAEEMETFLAALQTLQMRYINRKNIYEVGKVSADVFVHYENGSDCHFFISDNGAVRYNDKNYRCNDPAALQDLLTQIESWELYHESTP